MPEKIIAGIDYSMSSPSICVHIGDNWHIDNCFFYYFIGNKKLQIKTEKIQGDPIPIFENTNESRWDAISTWAIDKVYVVDIIGLEGYAFGAKGQIFNIGENTGLLKHKLHKSNKTIKIFTPGTIKKFATGKGNADKQKMFDSFLKETGLDLTQIIPAKVDANPISDIVDSYFIAKHAYYDSKI